MRRFEKPGRFWQAEVRDVQVYQQWGDPATRGKSHEHFYASPAEAEAKLAEMIAARLADGYGEVEERPRHAWPSPVISPPVMRRLEGHDKAGRHLVEMFVVGTTLRFERTLVTGDDDEVPADIEAVEHPTADTARDVLDRVTAGYLARGFTLLEPEVPMPVDRAAITHRSAELEAQCREAPDDPAPWLVYADWLLTRGDPIGEIAALRAAGKPASAELLAARRGKSVWGEHDLLVRARAGDLAWRHGFLCGVTVRAQPGDALTPVEMTRELLALPIARFVDSLCIEVEPWVWPLVLAEICASPHAAHLRELRFVALYGGGPEVDLAAVRALPALERLDIVGADHVVLGELAMPRLRRFARRTHALRRDELAVIHAARWPRLAHLELGTGDRGVTQCTLADLERIAQRDDMLELVHLGLVGCHLADSAIEVLARSPLLPRLRTLDLSHSALAHPGAMALRAHVAAFRHLAWIDITDTTLANRDVVQLRKALPALRGEPRPKPPR